MHVYLTYFERYTHLLYYYMILQKAEIQLISYIHFLSVNISLDLVE